MAFKKFNTNKYPTRQWAIVSFAGDGKSTFATQMKGPLLAIDSDHRFGEVSTQAKDGAYQLSDEAADNNNPDKITQVLERDMPGSGIQTIVVDSVTAIIQPFIMKAFRGNLNGENKNKVAAFADKATAMRRLQYAVTRWGVDTLWIWHLKDGRDAKGKEVVTQTLSPTERKRIFSSLNMVLHIERNGEKRGIKVVWARNGRQFPEVPILWDDSGVWLDMPDRIEREVYANGVLNTGGQPVHAISREVFMAAAPTSPFVSAEAAIDWAVEVEAFGSSEDAQTAYDKVKANKRPGSAAAMRNLWVSAVADELYGTVLDAAFPRDENGEPVAA